MTVACIGAPEEFPTRLGPLPDGIHLHHGGHPADMYILFARWENEIRTGFDDAIAHIPADGAIWVAWPKKSSGVATDLTEDRMRELFIPTGLVDNKVCAIDDVWSGLRFVVRKENRPAWGS